MLLQNPNSNRLSAKYLDGILIEYCFLLKSSNRDEL